MKLLEGEVGRWFIVELLPPYMLVAAIIPLTVFWKVPADITSTAFLHVLGGGDVLAVSFCLILSALAAAIGADQSNTHNRPKTYYIELQSMILVIMMLICYAAIKSYPVDVHKNMERAIGYSVLNVLVALWVGGLIYIIKLKGRL